MSTFLNMLKQQSKTVTSPGNTVNQEANNQSIFVESAKVAPIIETINGGEMVVTKKQISIDCKIIQDKNRLDLYFSDIPAKSDREILKEQGFRFNPDSKCWYHKDCLVNRLFLSDTFGLKDLMVKPESDEPAKVSFENYKKQVDALLQELNCDAADLALIAVNHLYNETFKMH